MMLRKWRLILRRAKYGTSGGRCLRDDLCNGPAPLAYMDFAECRGFTDPSSRFVVKLADGDRLHVTHCVTCWERVESRAFERIAN
jgi:hypothetical protein